MKGLIIEDDQGHSRILIGAPVPAVPDRLRQNSPSTSMVFLDDKGHDRFLVGEAVSPTPTFHRIGASYGLTIFDAEGNERGGMGFLSNGSTVSRAAIALDRSGNASAPADAWGAIVDDKSGSPAAASSMPRRLGTATKQSWLEQRGGRPSSASKTSITRNVLLSLSIKTAVRHSSSSMQQASQVPICCHLQNNPED